jgi:hypothetical protein
MVGDPLIVEREVCVVAAISRIDIGIVFCFHAFSAAIFTGGF